MPWRIENGQPVRVGLTPQEVTVTKEFDDLADDVLTCPECDREYKTEAGLENHLATKH